MGTWSKKGLALMLFGIFLLLVQYTNPPMDFAFFIMVLTFHIGFGIMLVDFDRK